MSKSSHVGRKGLVFGLMLALAACGATKDPLEDLAAGERGRVVRVLDGDALVLDGTKRPACGHRSPGRALS